MFAEILLFCWLLKYLNSVCNLSPFDIKIVDKSQIMFYKKTEEKSKRMIAYRTK